MTMTKKEADKREERRRFAAEYARANPGASVESTRKALIAKFGISLGTTYISKVLHEARTARSLGGDAYPADRPGVEVSETRPALDGGLSAAIDALRGRPFTMVVGRDGCLRIEVPAH